MKRHPTKIILSILVMGLVVGVAVTYAQDVDPVSTVELGEIPDSLLSMEEYPADPDAPFFYAFNGLDIFFEEENESIIAVMRYHVRIKVFDEENKEASLVGISYYFEDDIERISNIRGVTVQPDGERVSLDPDRIRTINANSRYNIKEFEMPEVREGSVIDYTYEIRRRYIEELPSFDLAHQVPTAVSQASLLLPPYLRYQVIAEHTDLEPERYEERIDTSSAPKVFSIPRPAPMMRQHWTVKDVPAVEEELYISSINDYRPRLNFLMSEFGNPRQELINSWEYIAGHLRRIQNPWKQIDTATRADSLGREIANHFESPEQRQDSIFAHLNKRMNFDGQRGAFGEFDEDFVLDGNASNQPAINQVLVAMLQGAGIEAAPVFTSTRSFGEINTSIPSYFQFNSMLVYSQIDGRSFLMDASFPESQPGLIDTEAYTDSGMVYQKNDYEWIALDPAKSFYSISVEVDGRLSSRGDLSGSVYAEHEGYSAQVVREKMAEGEGASQAVEEILFDGQSGLQLENAVVEQTENYRQPVILRADFTLEEYAISYQDGLDFRPMIVGDLSSNPFEETDRKLPVTLNAPERLKLDYQIEVPPDYSQDEQDQGNVLELPGARLEENYRSGGTLLSYNFDIDIRCKHFEVQDYPRLRELYERWVEISRGNWTIGKN